MADRSLPSNAVVPPPPRSAAQSKSGLGREGGRDGIGEYLETKLGGFSI